MLQWNGSFRHNSEGRNYLEIGSLGRYQVRGELGRGSMGVVYRGYDPVLDREIALKAVDVPLALDPARRQRFLERFFLEAKIAAKLIHPNIVVTHDAATDESTAIPFIAMELLSGDSLHARLQQGPVGWQEALSLIEPLARALDYAHQADVVHRDIKPANVLLTAKGVPKIADFGIAKLPDTHLTQSGKIMGTPYFMSPEQLEGDEVDGRSDLFSLGALLYNLLTAEPPFQGADLANITQQVLYKSPTPPSELVEGVPGDVDAVVARAMTKKRDERYQSGDELANDLARVGRGEPPERPLSFGEQTLESAPSRPDPEPEPEPEPKLELDLLPLPEREASSSGWIVVVLLLVALVAGVAFRWDVVAEILEPLREQQREESRREGVRLEAADSLTEARVFLERGHYNRSRELIENALTLSRNAKDGAGEATALLWRGRLEAEQGSWSKARADLEASASVFAIYEVPAGRAEATLALADLERDLGNFDVASTLYDASDPIVDTTFGRALLALMQDDLESAERGFESANELFYAGAVAFARGDRDEAEARWSQCPDSPELLLWRGYAALITGESDDAQRLFDESADAYRALEHEPGLRSASGNIENQGESQIQTLFRAEPRTPRSEERRKRLP